MADGTDEDEELNPEQTHQVKIHRRVYLQDNLNVDADYHRKPNQTFIKRVMKIIKQCNLVSCLKNSVPIIHWLPQYKPVRYLQHDVIAGITTGVLHLPYGIAYSLLAGLPPVVGLYMAFFPVFMYIILGNSPHICLGAFAMVMLMTGKVVQEESGPPTTGGIGYTPGEVASALTFNIGVILLIMCVLRLGALSSLLPEPLVSAMTAAASIIVCFSQFKDILGISLPQIQSNFNIIRVLKAIVARYHEINWPTVILSVVTLVIIIWYVTYVQPHLRNRFYKLLRYELILLLVGTLFAKLMNLEKNYGIKLVGSIPTGLPAPKLPPLVLMKKKNMIVNAITITLVTYTITMAKGFMIAAQEIYEIDANQELLALGASNIFGSLFGCAPVCASLLRSSIQHYMGCKTLVTAFVSSQFILLNLLWFAPVFENVPRCVLAALVLVALRSLYMHIYDFVKFWKLSKLDTIVWVVTFVVSLLGDIDFGLAAGMLTGIATLFYISQTSYSCLLGRVLHTNLYLDIRRYRAAREIPGIKIFHFCGGLNFASKNVFRDKLYRKTGFLRLIDQQIPVDDEENLTATSYVWNTNISHMIQCIIIDASALSYLDAPGIKIIIDVTDAIRASNITPLLAGVNAPILEMIDRFNSLEKNRLQLDIFPTVHDAVAYFKSVEEPLNSNVSQTSIQS